jgi:hypothetical protein
MAFVVMTRRNLSALKSSLRSTLPQVGSAHADEALAAGIGFRTHAALLAALKAQSGAKVTVLLNEQIVVERIVELTGDKLESHALMRLVWTTELPDGPNPAMHRSWWTNVANEN